MRAVTAATASDVNRKMMPLLVAVAEQLDDLMPRMTAPNTHAGMLKKKRANGYSATNTRNTHSSTGREPGLGQVDQRADDAGDDRRSGARNTANWLRPSSPSTCRPKYQKMASVTTIQTWPCERSLAWRPRGEPPHLAVEHLVADRAAAQRTRGAGDPRAPR